METNPINAWLFAINHGAISYKHFHKQYTGTMNIEVVAMYQVLENNEHAMREGVLYERPNRGRQISYYFHLYEIGNPERISELRHHREPNDRMYKIKWAKEGNESGIRYILMNQEDETLRVVSNFPYYDFYYMYTLPHFESSLDQLQATLLPHPEDHSLVDQRWYDQDSLPPFF